MNAEIELYWGIQAEQSGHMIPSKSNMGEQKTKINTPIATVSSSSDKSQLTVISISDGKEW